jgi:hypothetical protein
MATAVNDSEGHADGAGVQRWLVRIDQLLQPSIATPCENSLAYEPSWRRRYADELKRRIDAAQAIDDTVDGGDGNVPDHCPTTSRTTFFPT